MKVKFANAEVDVWKLRKGVVLGCGSQYVHLVSFVVYEDGARISVMFDEGSTVPYPANNLEWLSPH